MKASASTEVMLPCDHEDLCCLCMRDYRSFLNPLRVGKRAGEKYLPRRGPNQNLCVSCDGWLESDPKRPAKRMPLKQIRPLLHADDADPELLDSHMRGVSLWEKLYNEMNGRVTKAAVARACGAAPPSVGDRQIVGSQACAQGSEMVAGYLWTKTIFDRRSPVLHKVTGVPLVWDPKAAKNKVTHMGQVFKGMVLDAEDYGAPVGTFKVFTSDLMAMNQSSVIANSQMVSGEGMDNVWKLANKRGRVKAIATEGTDGLGWKRMKVGTELETAVAEEACAQGSEMVAGYLWTKTIFDRRSPVLHKVTGVPLVWDPKAAKNKVTHMGQVFKGMVLDAEDYGAPVGTFKVFTSDLMAMNQSSVIANSQMVSGEGMDNVWKLANKRGRVKAIATEGTDGLGWKRMKVGTELETAVAEETGGASLLSADWLTPCVNPKGSKADLLDEAQTSSSGEGRKRKSVSSLIVESDCASSVAGEDLHQFAGDESQAEDLQSQLDEIESGTSLVEAIENVDKNSFAFTSSRAKFTPMDEAEAVIVVNATKAVILEVQCYLSSLSKNSGWSQCTTEAQVNGLLRKVQSRLKPHVVKYYAVLCNPADDGSASGSSQPDASDTKEVVKEKVPKQEELWERLGKLQTVLEYLLPVVSCFRNKSSSAEKFGKTISNFDDTIPGSLHTLPGGCTYIM